MSSILRVVQVVILGFGLVATPLTVEAQNPTAVRIGWRGLAAPGPTVLRIVDAFKEGLRQFGYVEGQNLAFEYRWAHGQSERLPELAAELVVLKVDVIAVANTLGVVAARQATTTPHVLISKSIEAAARSSKIHLQPVSARTADDLDTAFSAMVRARADALIVLSDPLFLLHRQRLADLAAKYRLPAMYGLTEHAEAGGLMAYSASFPDVARHAAAHVERILRGARPATSSNNRWFDRPLTASYT